MALKYYSGLLITGTNADRTGGTWTNLPAGWKFLETDTQIGYYWTGSAWVASSLADRTYTVKCFKDGSKYYAIKYDGTVISSGTVAETVLAAAIANKGTIYLANSNSGSFTTWDFSGALGATAFTVPEYTYLVGDGAESVFLMVPNGYTGTLFQYGNTVDNTGYGSRGFSMGEAGTPLNLWNAMYFKMDSTKAMQFSLFEDLYIYSPNIGIELETSNSRWINSNEFRNIRVYSPVIGYLFDLQSGSMICNGFYNCHTQTAAQHAFKNVDGIGNAFYNCQPWDTVAGNVDMNIKSTAVATLIDGGLIGHFGALIDQSPSTIIKTMLQGKGGRYSTFLATPDVCKYGSFHGYANGQECDGFLNSRVSTSVVGTGTKSNTLDSTGTFVTFDTGATINSIFGHRSSVTVCRRDLNAYFKAAIFPNQSSAMRIFAGFNSDSNAATSLADPLNGKSGVALWFDSAVNANWRRFHNDGTGAGVSDDTGLVVNSSTMYVVEIFAMAPFNKFRFILNGAATDITTEIPAATTNLAFHVYLENTAAAQKNMRVYYYILRNDK